MLSILMFAYSYKGKISSGVGRSKMVLTQQPLARLPHTHLDFRRHVSVVVFFLPARDAPLLI